MTTSIASLYELFNAKQYDACMQQLQSVTPADLAADAAATVAYHDLYGRVCYMLGLYDQAEKSVAAGAAVGGAQQLAPLTQAVADARNLLAKAPAVFSSGDWARGKDVLRIGGSITHPYQVQLAQAQRVFDTNSQTGYTANVDLLLDAHRMPSLKDGEFDAVCSAHTIEHLINPLLALEEWRRVLKPGGLILSVVPNKEKTFDHKRPLTTLEHLIEDYKSGSTALNWHHVLEFLRGHDVDRDIAYKGDKEAHFRHVIDAPQFNVHVHVFDLPLVYVMHEYAGFKTLGAFEADVGIYYFGQKKP